MLLKRLGTLWGVIMQCWLQRLANSGGIWLYTHMGTAGGIRTVLIQDSRLDSSPCRKLLGRRFRLKPSQDRGLIEVYEDRVEGCGYTARGLFCRAPPLSKKCPEEQTTLAELLQVRSIGACARKPLIAVSLGTTTITTSPLFYELRMRAP